MFLEKDQASINIKKKQILIINPQQFGYGAGYFYYVKYLRKFFKIDYLTFDKKWKKVEMENVNIVYRNYNTNKMLRLLDFIYTAIKMTHQLNYDIVFSIDFNLVFLIGLLCRGRLKIYDIRTGALLENLIKRFFFNSIKLFNSFFF